MLLHLSRSIHITESNPPTMAMTMIQTTTLQLQAVNLTMTMNFLNR
jgi:hypothetical protein